MKFICIYTPIIPDETLPSAIHPTSEKRPWRQRQMFKMFCSQFDLDKSQNDDDKVFETNGIKVVIDEMSLELLDGSEVDYVDDLAGASFRLKIPNATASCGCGISFSV